MEYKESDCGVGENPQRAAADLRRTSIIRACGLPNATHMRLFVSVQKRKGSSSVMIRIADYFNVKQYLPQHRFFRPSCPPPPVIISGRVFDQSTGAPPARRERLLGSHAMETRLLPAATVPFLPPARRFHLHQRPPFQRGYLRRSIGCYLPRGEQDDFFLCPDGSRRFL